MYGYTCALSNIPTLKTTTMKGATILINQTNLLINLDASISSSYNGSGTTWTDLTGNLYNGTLINGTAYSSANGGSLVFDGVNDYVEISKTFAPGTSNFTIGTWIKIPASQTSTTGFLGKFRAGSRAGRIGVYYTSTFAKSIIEFDGGVTSTLTSTTAINNNNWYYLVQTINRSGNHTLYVNGVSQASGVISANSAFNIDWATPLRMGTFNNASDVPSNFMNGNIAMGHVYTRELSAAEVLANFNATKTKYGL